MPRGVYARTTGIHALTKACVAHEARTAVGHNRGLKAVGKFLLKESQKIVPYETWYLHDSGYTATRNRGYNAVQETGYRAYYAIWQHENLEWRHQPGRSAKFLEKPARRFRKQMVSLYKWHLVRHKKSKVKGRR